MISCILVGKQLFNYFDDNVLLIFCFYIGILTENGFPYGGIVGGREGFFHGGMDAVVVVSVQYWRHSLFPCVPYNVARHLLHNSGMTG